MGLRNGTHIGRVLLLFDSLWRLGPKSVCSVVYHYLFDSSFKCFGSH